jgi:hypothetical protein
MEVTDISLPTSPESPKSPVLIEENLGVGDTERKAGLN